MTKCDYCKKTAYWIIFACKDHLKVLDKNHSRKESHSINYSTTKELQAHLKEKEELIQKLKAELEVLKEESRKPKRVEVKPYDKEKIPFVKKPAEQKKGSK